MKEFIKSCVDSYSERIKNPLIGTFSISFILYNWRPIFILLFSDFAMEEKISIIDTYYCNYQALFWPIIITLIYVLIIPYFNLIIDRILGLSKSEKYKVRNKIIDENMEIRKKQAKNEKEIADLRAGTNETNELQARIEVLTQENNLKSNQITEIIEKNNLDTTSYNDAFKANSSLIKQLEIELKKVDHENSELRKQNAILKDEEGLSDSELLNHIKSNISNSEIATLKSRQTKLDASNFRPHILNLLIRTSLAAKWDDDTISLTQSGHQFVTNLKIK